MPLATIIKKLPRSMTKRFPILFAFHVSVYDITESPIIVKDMNIPILTSEIPSSLRYNVKIWFVKPKEIIRMNTENHRSRISAEDCFKERSMCVIFNSLACLSCLVRAMHSFCPLLICLVHQLSHLKSL